MSEPDLDYLKPKNNIYQEALVSWTVVKDIIIACGITSIVVLLVILSGLIDLVDNMENHLDLYKKEIGVNCE